MVNFCVIKLLSIRLLTLVLLLSIIALPLSFVHAQEKVGDFKLPSEDGKPLVKDSNLKVQEVVSGLDFPTTFAFLDRDNILVLEKDKGTVQRVMNGTIISNPLLDADVNGLNERGMLGIAVSKGQGTNPYVFLYYTEAEPGNGDTMSAEKTPLGNRLYRYELADNKLVNPKLLLNLPAMPGPSHNGGGITLDPDGNLYIVVGDAKGSGTEAMNRQGEPEPDGRSGILRITQNGELVDSNGILGDEHPLNIYYAYGIRNSFGLDFDPVTGNLWDTEVGNRDGEEINLVEPGFNSGYSQVQGLASEDFDNGTLVDFDGRGKYSDPEFSWNYRVTPTALKFLNSKILGVQYESDLFVGGFNEGIIYHFDLNEDRTEVILGNVDIDKVVNSQDEVEDVIFGRNFGAITDIEVGPDGYLYVLSLSGGEQGGTIYRIGPSNNTSG
jgi:aldose sugar dehydrogenase